jgi:hypothetical protein
MIDFKGIENAIVSTLRAAGKGTDLSSTDTPLQWVTTSLGVVTEASQVFSAATITECIALRDVYFTDNPLLLIEGVGCTLYVTGKYPIKQIYTTSKLSVIRTNLYDTNGKTTSRVQPDFPFVSIHFTRTLDDGANITDISYRDNGDKVYQTHKTVVYSIKVQSTTKYSAQTILNKLHMMLEVDGVRDMLSTLSPTTLSILGKSQQNMVSANMQDKALDVASFDLTLAVLDEEVIATGDWGTEYIENVEMYTAIPQLGVDGGLFSNEEHIADVDVDTNITY